MGYTLKTPDEKKEKGDRFIFDRIFSAHDCES